jgi:hypothetical protein
MTRHDVYFGRQTPHGAVTEEQFDAFLKAEVDSRLEGYTIIEAKGYWHGTPEGSWDLQAIDADPVTVDAIASAYARRFEQEAVYVTSGTIASKLVTAAVEAPASPIARSASAGMQDSHPGACDSLAGAVARMAGILAGAAGALRRVTRWRVLLALVNGF